uniref:PNPLA domain-containing protein n=1 Tax=Toxocara canis TaxID=6265 RepID=A0A183USS5_TOXCA
LCSCFIPYYCGRTPPEFRGEQYFDGGWSDNQPVIDDNTITISPFSGDLFDFGFAGTSIRFTARNIYRMTVCLIPPSTEVCSRICRQGFEDAVRFLTRNGIVPCMRCLAVQSNLVDAYTAKITANTRTRSQHQLPSSASRRRLDAECNACIENNDVGGSTPISSLFPQIMQKTLDEALEGENRLYAYLFSFRILRWLRNLAAPVTLPFEILFIICKNITNWLAGLMTTNWVTERLQLVVDFVLKELGNQKAMYSARLSYQLAVTELDVNNTSRYWQCNEHVLNINLSADAQLELDALRRCDSLASRKRLLPSTQSSEKPLKGLAKDAAETSAEKNLEVLNHVVQYAKAHDALRMCEIFDVRNAERRHRCHSHLEYDPPVLDSRRARYQSQLANENSDSESSPDDSSGREEFPDESVCSFALHTFGQDEVAA